MELRTIGWDQTLKKRKPEAEIRSGATIGDFLDKVSSQYIGQKRTIDDYCRSFRRMVADIFEIPRDEKRYDYFNRGRLEWVEKVNAIRLVNLTPEKIQAWLGNLPESCRGGSRQAPQCARKPQFALASGSIAL